MCTFLEKSKNLEKKVPRWDITSTYEITPIYLSKVCPKIAEIYYKKPRRL